MALPGGQGMNAGGLSQFCGESTPQSVRRPVQSILRVEMQTRKRVRPKTSAKHHGHAHIFFGVQQGASNLSSLKSKAGKPKHALRASDPAACLRPL